MLSCAGALASGNFYLGTMRVVNCEEWVSLRLLPDASSERIDKVPLGAVVEAYYENEEFTYCYYDTRWGYIRNEYLAMESAYDPTGLGSVRRSCWNASRRSRLTSRTTPRRRTRQLSTGLRSTRAS